jgi:hypothetical protein
VSYGGSSLLVNSTAMGVLLGISRRTESRRNARTVASGPLPEASAMLVTEATFAPEAVRGAKRAPQEARA